MTYIIAEIGINHNGDLDLAKSLIEHARAAGCDAVKFQKRTPRVCVPKHEWDKRRDTPWGEMSYIEYKERIEFGETEYDAIADLCASLEIDWSASPWDNESLEFLLSYSPPFIKIASASLTDVDLLRQAAASGVPLIVSTGMSTIEELDAMWEIVKGTDVTLLHTNSTYPCPPEEANLAVMKTLSMRYGCPIGYSGHEAGLQISLAAVALGAVVLERHMTLDRTMWGTDHSASIEPDGMRRLVRDTRIINAAIGTGEKAVWPGEIEPRRRLRGEF